SARDAACNIVVADDKATDVDTLDLLPIRRRPHRELAVKARCLHFDLSQPGNLLICEIENQLARALNIGGFVPAGFRNRQTRSAKVEQRLDLGAPSIKGGIGQIDAYGSADPV